MCIFGQSLFFFFLRVTRCGTSSIAAATGSRIYRLSSSCRLGCGSKERARYRFEDSVELKASWRRQIFGLTRGGDPGRWRSMLSRESKAARRRLWGRRWGKQDCDKKTCLEGWIRVEVWAARLSDCVFWSFLGFLSYPCNKYAFTFRQEGWP